MKPKYKIEFWASGIRYILQGNPRYTISYWYSYLDNICRKQKTTTNVNF